MGKQTIDSERLTSTEAEKDVIIQRFATAGNLSDEMIEELDWHLGNLIDKAKNEANETSEEKASRFSVDALVSSTPAWKSVDEVTPENSSKRYLCYMTSGAIKKGYYWNDQWNNDEYAGTFDDLGYTMTHFIELPEPPKDKT